MHDRSEQFEQNRDTMLAHAYRMLGDFGRAEDLVQEAWIRWSRCDETIEAPRAWLLKTITRLCLNELSSARARNEEARSGRLPEPVNLDEAGLSRVEVLDRVSMAFLVLLQRLTPAERAVLLLHEVFDLDHAEIARQLQKSEAACRQLLKRARDHVACERRTFGVPRATHERLLAAFVTAANSGDTAGLSRILSEDAVLIADAGPAGGYFGRVRNLPGPLVGREKVAAFVASVAPQGLSGLAASVCELNGGPAILLRRDGEPVTAIVIAIAGDCIQSIFIQADPGRLGHVGRLAS